jgi:hypothetical protein
MINTLLLNDLTILIQIRLAGGNRRPLLVLDLRINWCSKYKSANCSNTMYTYFEIIPFRGHHRVSCETRQDPCCQSVRNLVNRDYSIVVVCIAESNPLLNSVGYHYPGKGTTRSRSQSFEKRRFRECLLGTFQVAAKQIYACRKFQAGLVRILSFPPHPLPYCPCCSGGAPVYTCWYMLGSNTPG